MYSPGIDLTAVLVGFVALAVLTEAGAAEAGATALAGEAVSSRSASSVGSLATGDWQPMSAIAPAAHRPLRNFVTVLRCIRISCWGYGVLFGGAGVPVCQASWRIFSDRVPRALS